MPEIDNPFDGEAVRLIRDQGMNEQDARDRVVLRYLREGDTRALAHWWTSAMTRSYSPGSAVIQCLVAMLQEDHPDAQLSTDCPAYKLVTRRRGGKGGRRTSLPGGAERDFDNEAADFARERGIKQRYARVEITLRDLRLGDTRALTFWLEKGYQPGPQVKRLVGDMLQPERETADEAQEVVPADLTDVPYELISKRRNGEGGPPRKPLTHEQNQAVKDYYDKRMLELGPGSSDAVIKEMVDELPGLSESQIREATKNRSPKSGKAGKKGGYLPCIRLALCPHPEDTVAIESPLRFSTAQWMEMARWWTS